MKDLFIGSINVVFIKTVPPYSFFYTNPMKQGITFLNRINYNMEPLRPKILKLLLSRLNINFIVYIPQVRRMPSHNLFLKIHTNSYPYTTLPQSLSQLHPQ